MEKVVLIDTGPIVALFDPRDHQHQACQAIFAQISVSLHTTIPVLTEAFHLLAPQTPGAAQLREFLHRGGIKVWYMDDSALRRSFQLMSQYLDHSMDLADASLIAAMESLKTNRIFTLDHRDFYTYRIRRGHRYLSPEILS